MVWRYPDNVVRSLSISGASRRSRPVDEIDARLYREAGFRFAIDDFGEGHSGFALLEATRPDYLKLSRKLTHGMDIAATRPLLAAALAYANSSGCELIAEGVETEANAEALQGVGVRLAQGYHLGRPAAPAVLLRRLAVEAEEQVQTARGLD